MLACYANGRIGYLPDEHDIAARSYAGYQSPKYCDQFPFTPESGPPDVRRDAARPRALPRGGPCLIVAGWMSHQINPA